MKILYFFQSHVEPNYILNVSIILPVIKGLKNKDYNNLILKLYSELSSAAFFVL